MKPSAWTCSRVYPEPKVQEMRISLKAKEKAMMPGAVVMRKNRVDVTRLACSKNFVGIHDAMRVERVFDLAHEGKCCGVF